jgi:hypothetical protein
VSEWEKETGKMRVKQGKLRGPHLASVLLICLLLLVIEAV